MKAYMRALDAQLDLIRFWKGPYGPAVGKTWTEMIRGEGPAPCEGMHFDYGTGEQFAGREADMLNRADTYWVSPAMVDVFDSQRERLPSYELRSNDIPSRNGFAFFSKPVYINDRHDKRCNVQAFSWAVEALVVTGPDKKPAPITPEEIEEAFALDVRPIPEDFQQLEPINDVGTIHTPVLKREDGTMIAKAVRFFVYSDRDDPLDESWGDAPNVEALKKIVPCRWSLFHVDAWVLNQMLPEAHDDRYEGADPFLRVAASFWTMCNQKVVVTHPQAADRAMRRRAARQDFLGTPSEIRVVVLRRELDPHRERPEPSGEGAWYSHSFWVDGHLRNQWYPSEGRHKPIWIDSYVKGNGPLIMKDKVFRVSR
jgi:hypothetical protein